MNEQKRCSTCKVFYPLSEFHKNAARKDKLHNACKVCTRKAVKQNRLLNPEGMERKKRQDAEKAACRKAGITVAYLHDYGDELEWYCEICGKDIIDALNVDHDHVTGSFRGILCRACNQGLGHFQDSPQLLENAIKYLKEKP